MKLPSQACGLDFGTSNSTIGFGGSEGARLVALEGGRTTLPSAIFHPFDGAEPKFGRAALEAYVDGEQGRLMRALKSILGTSLIHEQTRVGRRSLKFTQILGALIARLKSSAEAAAGAPLTQVVMGRPVRFVDGDDDADSAAQAALEGVAHACGFKHVAFQYEPIAAALDFERGVAREELALIVDIGGGTSDFSLIRVSPEGRRRADRSGDILANAGVHVGGTDFDRLLNLAAVAPHLGFKTQTLDGKRELPSAYFHDLATWQFINRLYTGKVLHELREVRFEAARRDRVERLLILVQERRGHALAMAVEGAKIALTEAQSAPIDLGPLCDGPLIEAIRKNLDAAITGEVAKVEATVRGLLAAAALKPGAVARIFVTGGSSAVPLLRAAITALLPGAGVVEGDAFGSVGLGLALEAGRRFG